MPKWRGSSIAGGDGFEPSTPNLGGWRSICTEHRESYWLALFAKKRIHTTCRGSVPFEGTRCQQPTKKSPGKTATPKTFKPQTKKQPKTQKATAKSRNFH